MEKDGVICIIEDDIEKFQALIDKHEGLGYELTGPLRSDKGSFYAAMRLKKSKDENIKSRRVCKEKPDFVKMKNFLIDYFSKNTYRPISQYAEFKFKINKDGTIAQVVVMEEFERGKDSLIMMCYDAETGYTIYGPLKNGSLGKMVTVNKI